MIDAEEQKETFYFISLYSLRYHNGEVIRQSLRHRIDYDKIFHNLNIMRVSEADQGEYTVKAVNQYGEMTHTMKVEVAREYS